VTALKLHDDEECAVAAVEGLPRDSQEGGRD